MRKTIMTLLLLLATSMAAQEPSFYWNVDMSVVFDNREGDRTYAQPKTFFQTQLAPEIGLTLEDGRHRIAGGAVWTQPIGCEWEGHRISPTLYYRYQEKGLRGLLGMFSRDELYAELPNYIWNDSIKYAQHNIRGALLGYRNEKGYFQAILDWRGMQTKNQREAFNIIAMGERNYAGGKFLWGATAMMNHLALDKSGNPDQHVVDNFIYNSYIGADFAKIASTPLDSCTLRIGMLGDITRDRGDRKWNGGSKWRTPKGIWVDFDVRWKFLEFKDTFYAGRKLFPLYSKFGILLDQGEPYYAASLYNRTSVSATLLRRSFMDLRASLDFNICPSHFNFYQRLILNFNI